MTEQVMFVTSCESNDGRLRNFDGEVLGMKYIFYCTILEIVIFVTFFGQFLL